MKDVSIPEKALRHKMAILIVSKASMKGDCVWYSASLRYPRESQVENFLYTPFPNLGWHSEEGFGQNSETLDLTSGWDRGLVKVLPLGTRIPCLNTILGRRNSLS